MDERGRRRVSRFMSYLLRHAPEEGGLSLDGGGWVPVSELLAVLRDRGLLRSREELEEVVRRNDKQRFGFDKTGTRIRAHQGHSIPVDLGLSPAEPPERLFHGTVAGAVSSIRKEGLRPGSRNHVHLSPDRSTARAVGARRGSPVILEIRAGDLYRTGHTFRLSDNGIWLTRSVPPEFIEFPEPSGRD